jgi:hypothetical protein
VLGSRRVNPRTEANSCEILSNHHQGINGKKTTYLARLQYCDNGARRERKRSASSPAEAKRGELIPVAHETKRERLLTAEEEVKLLAACETDKRRHLKALIHCWYRLRLSAGRATRASLGRYRLPSQELQSDEL